MPNTEGCISFLYVDWDWILINYPLWNFLYAWLRFLLVNAIMFDITLLSQVQGCFSWRTVCGGFSPSSKYLMYNWWLWGLALEIIYDTWLLELLLVCVITSSVLLSGEGKDLELDPYCSVWKYLWLELAYVNYSKFDMNLKCAGAGLISLKNFPWLGFPLKCSGYLPTQ